MLLRRWARRALHSHRRLRRRIVHTRHDPHHPSRLRLREDRPRYAPACRRLGRSNRGTPRPSGLELKRHRDTIHRTPLGILHPHDRLGDRRELSIGGGHRPKPDDRIGDLQGKDIPAASRWPHQLRRTGSTTSGKPKTEQNQGHTRCHQIPHIPSELHTGACATPLCKVPQVGTCAGYQAASERAGDTRRSYNARDTRQPRGTTEGTSWMQSHTSHRPRRVKKSPQS